MPAPKPRAPRARTYREAASAVMWQRGFEWTRAYWQPCEFIVMVNRNGKPAQWAVPEIDRPLPRESVELLGCSGLQRDGHYAWLGWDLDVGHGVPVVLVNGERVAPYATLDDALSDAHKLREALSGGAEIRLSKSGNGVHVRTVFDPAEQPEKAAGIEWAKKIAADLKLKADASPLGRQQWWLWSRRTAPRAFELIVPQAGGSA